MTHRLRPFLIFLFLTICAPAFAQNKEVSESDKAVFAFFHLGGGTPAYEEWVRNSEKYLLSAEDPKLQSEIFEIELLRLKYGFGTYDPDNDFIKIRTPVRLMVHNQLDGETLSFMFPAVGQGKVPYFPFAYGKESIALIVNDLEAFLNISLPPGSAKDAHMILAINKIYDGEIIVRIRPTKADKTAPLKMDGVDQWLLMGETGYMELVVNWDGTEKSLYSWTAPWYLTDTERNLLPLLEKPR
jgi:hypothetical protein